jgi:MraZ protein
MGRFGKKWDGMERPRTDVFFRGAGWTQFDTAGRMVVPTNFRKRLLESYGAQVFVTQSFWPEFPHIVIYPLPVWETIEAEIRLQTDIDPRQKMALMHRLNTRGVETELDDKGRILVPPELREYARLASRAILVGYFNTIQVWNPDLLEAFQAQVPWTPELVQSIQKIQP